MKDKLWPITLTRTISDIHSGGFSINEEKELGFKEGELFEKPTELWEVITFHKKNLGRNLNLYKEKILREDSNYTEKEDGVFIHASAQVHQSTVFDTKDGIIVIEANVQVKPFTYFVGPLRIRESATIAPHAYIGQSVIGKYCKIGGEVFGMVIEDYSNKTHHGCVADGYIGSWVNLGGGTSSSSLKNTYGKVKLGGIETGEDFIGPIIADHVKTAINTSIYTAKIIGVNSHIYGTVTCDVPSFSNYISKDNMTILPLEIAIKIAEKMQARRNTKITEEDKAVLSYSYEQTKDERNECGVKEGKLLF
jgi:glucose-1-phosphate thymidylyltransferase